MTTLITSIPKDTVLARLAALHAMPIAELKQQWRELFGKEPPPFSRTFIQSRLGYRIQELAYGGLKPETVARLEAIGEQLDGGNAIIRRIRHQNKPIAGTRLIREWKGVEQTVTVCSTPFHSRISLVLAIGLSWCRMRRMMALPPSNCSPIASSRATVSGFRPP